MAGLIGIEQHVPITPLGIGPCAPSCASWLDVRPYPGQYRSSCSGNRRQSRLPAGSSAPTQGSRITRCRTKRSISACLSRHVEC